jgi:hypothetical protein
MRSCRKGHPGQNGPVAIWRGCGRIAWLVRRVTSAVDRLEETLWGKTDAAIDRFRSVMPSRAVLEAVAIEPSRFLRSLDKQRFEVADQVTCWFGGDGQPFQRDRDVLWRFVVSVTALTPS